jgi:hypothetical protein
MVVNRRGVPTPIGVANVLISVVSKRSRYIARHPELSPERFKSLCKKFVSAIK